MNFVSPSLLSCDFANLEQEVKLCEASGATFLHLDVMDGLFVTNITIGPVVIDAVKKISSIPLDVHLMIQSPEKYIESFVKAGADILTIHTEATIHLERTIKLIKSFGVKAGVSLVPSTHESCLEYILEELDLVLVMTVNPGFGGQKFIHSQVKKIENISKMIAKVKKDIILEVDGGIDDVTARIAKNAGANCFVAGNYLFTEKQNMKQKITLLKNL